MKVPALTTLLWCAFMMAAAQQQITLNQPGVRITTNMTVRDAKPYPFESPVKGLEIASAAYQIDASNGGSFTHTSGTRITLPPNSLVDKEGNPIHGSVDFYYREFRDPIDFMLSGIPMSYDSAGTQYNFESAGMFELRAFQQGKEVYVAPGEQIDVDFYSTNSASTFNFYAFDETSGNWDFRGKAGEQAPGMAAEAHGGEEMEGGFSSNDMSNFWVDGGRYSEPMLFKERYQDLEYAQTWKIDSSQYGEAPNYPFDRYYVNLIRLKKQSKRLFSNKLWFKIKPRQWALRNRAERVNQELDTLEGVLWTYDGENPLVIKHMREEYTKSASRWNDVRLRYNNVTGKFIMELKDEEGYFKLPVEPHYKGRPKHEASRRKSDEKLYKGYWKQLKDNEHSFDFKLFSNFGMTDGRYGAFMRKSIKVREDYLNALKPGLAQAALASTTTYNPNQADARNVVRSLKVDGFGVWNCDQIDRLNNPVQIMADYRIKNKKHQPYTIYIIDRQINGVLNYTPDKIAFSRDAENILLAIGEDGSTALYNARAFRQVNWQNNTNHTFALEDMTGKYKTVDEFKRALGF